jgi:hypothetical protein
MACASDSQAYRSDASVGAAALRVNQVKALQHRKLAADGRVSLPILKAILGRRSTGADTPRLTKGVFAFPIASSSGHSRSQYRTPCSSKYFCAPAPCNNATVDNNPASVQLLAATVIERGESGAGQPVRGLTTRMKIHSG